jgi:hypothetical protein
MKIDSYQISQQSQSVYERKEMSEIEIQIQRFQPIDRVDVSEMGLKLQETQDLEEDFLSDSDKRKIELLESFISWITGKPFEFKGILKEDGKTKAASKEKESPNQEGPRGGIRIYTRHQFYEKEAMTYQASGQVKTSDGRQIDFNLNLHMSRETYESNEQMLQIGNFQDPLVLNFDGKGVDFSDQTLEIDMNLDGQLNKVNFLSRGNGFLALDKNDNGQIDDGSELFGPQTNNGFSELSQYDQDQNGWIDENDAIFKDLKIWTLNDRGERTLIGLKEQGVGAIYLGGIASKYMVKHGDEDMAKISQSSIYLKENGQVNSIHQVDYKL